MNIMVTGGAGFIGSQIADKYIELGHKVVIADNMSTGNEKYINPKAKFCEIDIRDEKIGKIIKENNIELINHHAAHINLRQSVADPKNDIDINITGSVNLFQHALNGGVKKIIFASSGGAIYGEEPPPPASEDFPVNPKSPYGINKLTIEKYLYYYYTVHNIDHVILRYANAYGPRQSTGGESGIVALFSGMLLNNRQPVINGDGNQSRDYVYVEDIVKANVLAIDSTTEKIYNIGTGIETTVNYIFNKLNEITGTSFKEVHGPAKIGEQRRSVLSYERINKELNWTPETNIESGLKQTFEFFKKQKN